MPRRLTLLMLLLVTLASPSLAEAAPQRPVLTEGHIDMGPRLVDGRWLIQVRDETVSPPVWHGLDDVVLRVDDAARTTVPDGSPFAFLGPPGSDTWLLPQAQQPGLLWPGWNTQDPGVTSSIKGSVTWTLHGVQGPGRFSLFVTGAFGEPTVLFDTAEPFPQGIGVELDTHAHGTWAFSAPGIYLLDIEMSAQSDVGQPFSDRRTLRFSVGPGDPQLAFAGDPTGWHSLLLPLLLTVTLGGVIGVVLLVVVRRRPARTTCLEGGSR
jgi:putative ABC transporter-associated repeat protein